MGSGVGTLDHYATFLALVRPKNEAESASDRLMPGFSA